MAGFSRDPLGNLTYTNQHNFKVALLYATDPNFNPEGIRVANLGATVTIPGGASKFAIALGPKTYAPGDNSGATWLLLSRDLATHPPALLTCLLWRRRQQPLAGRHPERRGPVAQSSPLPTRHPNFRRQVEQASRCSNSEERSCVGSVGHAVKLAAHLDSVFP